uniref:Uncharacterized protein n=1 Tax=Arundo donax TaxID=35708 RepID=A0A0A8ZAD7_ARUDO
MYTQNDKFAQTGSISLQTAQCQRRDCQVKGRILWFHLTSTVSLPPNSLAQDHNFH